MWIATLILWLSTIGPLVALQTPDVPAAPAVEPVFTVPDKLCFQEDGWWFFIGPDYMVGMAKPSCTDAYYDWHSNVPKPPYPKRA